MSAVQSRKPQTDEPPALHDKAMADLRFIRETMERSSSFTAVSGWGQLLIGVAALGATALAARQPTTERWLTVWLAAAAVSLAIALVSMGRKVRVARMPMLSAPAQKVMLGFAPPVFVGALLTLVLTRAGLNSLIPGVWLSLYGAGVVTGGAFSVKILPMMGLCFMAAGVCAFFVPIGWQPWLMAAAFGGLHIFFGIIIIRRHGG